MKLFQFSLSRMLSYKEQLEAAEKNKLAAANIKKNEIDDDIVKLRRQSAELSSRLIEAQKQGASMRDIQLLNFQIENNRMYLQQLAGDLVMATLAVERQLRVVLAATQEVEGLNKLKEKQYEEYLYEENQAQQLVVSEFVASKIIRDAKEEQEDIERELRKQA